MKKADFLSRLKQEGKLSLAEPSKEIKESYLVKSDNCLKSAKILLRNSLYENAVTESYYAMYNCLLALLYSAGIKSENHSASIILLGELFKAKELSKSISFAKKERIDKQYYVEPEQRYKITEESCDDMVRKAEDFIIGVKLLSNKLHEEDIASIRANFQYLCRER